MGNNLPFLAFRGDNFSGQEGVQSRTQRLRGALCLEKEGDLSEIQKMDCLKIEFLAMIQINRILFRFF